MSLLMKSGVGDGNGGGFEYLLDELVVEILSRLSAEQLWCRCRPVCRRWYTLISSPHFAHAHLQQSPHTSFIFNMLISRLVKLGFEYTSSYDDGSVFMKRGLVERWRPQMGDQPVAASCNGLVLFTRFSLSEVYIGNPTTKELITMTQPYKLLDVYTRKGYFCGFFYHTSTQEYKLLLCHETNSTDNPFEYAILTLGLTNGEASVPFLIASGSMIRGRRYSMTLFTG